MSTQKLTLTFDNGPTPGVTEKVLNVLEQRGLTATFFVIGQKAATDRGPDLIKAIRSAGHSIGNHTMTHGEPLGLLHDRDRELAEIVNADAVLEDLDVESRLFRPTGHGAIGSHLLTRGTADYLMAKKYSVVLWTLFVRDSKMPDGWVERALARLPERDHHVLVVHDLPTGAMDHLPRFLDAVAQRGIEVVTDFPASVVPLRVGIPAANFETDYVTTDTSS
ncbi:polysaccharide deacetylase family protein [Microbacterium sp. A93]